MSGAAITVLLFAELAEAAGCDQLSLAHVEGETVAALLDRLCAEHGFIASRRAAIAVAVDEQYRRGEDVIAAGATVALIPPVSGG